MGNETKNDKCATNTLTIMYMICVYFVDKNFCFANDKKERKQKINEKRKEQKSFYVSYSIHVTTIALQRKLNNNTNRLPAQLHLQQKQQQQNIQR